MMAGVRLGASTAVAALVASMAAVPGTASTASPPRADRVADVSAKPVPGGQIRVVLKGERFGRKAVVVVRGIRGRAKGLRARVKVKKSKTVKSAKRGSGAIARPLPPGRYRVTGRQITGGSRTARAAKVTVKVTEERGARATVRYRAETASQDDPTVIDPPDPTPTATPTPRDTTPPPDTTPPGPVTGLKTGKITGTEIKLEWTLPTDRDDIDRIVVRRGEGTTPPAGPQDGAPVALEFKKADFTTDEGLTPDSAYSYAVFVIDGSGNVSAAATLSTATEKRSILAEAVITTASGEVPIARVVDEDDSNTITIDDIVLLSEASTNFDGSATTPLSTRFVRVLGPVVTESARCSLRHAGNPEDDASANIMTFVSTGERQEWSDAGPAGTSTLTDGLEAGVNDVIALAPSSPSRPGQVADLSRSDSSDDRFLEVYPNCVTE